MSDGVAVINQHGELLGYGGMIDLSKITDPGLVGSGTSAAKLLSLHGLVVKVSHDGGITVFNDGAPILRF